MAQDNNTLEEIDLRQIIKVINKRKWVIALITFAALLAGGIVSYFIVQPVYESKATLLVPMSSDRERVVNNSENLESVISTISRTPQLPLDAYVSQLKNEILLQRVVDKLKLDPAVYKPASLSGIITVTPLKDSNLIELKVSHSDPVMASNIANTVIEEYLALTSENNQTKLTRSAGFLDEQRQLAEKDLDKVLMEIKALESEPMGIAFLEQQFNSKNQDLANYQSALNEAKVELTKARAGMESVAEELKKTPRTISNYNNHSKPGQTNIIGIPLTEEPNTFYDQLSQDYVARTTNVSELEAWVKVTGSVIGQIQADVNRIQKLLAEKTDQRERLEAQKTRLLSARNLLAEKATQAQIAKSIDLGETSMAVVSPAKVPTGPVKPNKPLNMAVALLLGLALGLFTAFIMEFLDNTIKTSREVEEKMNLPFLGAIPVTGRRKS